MNHKWNFLTAVVLAAGALTVSVTGCELIASVDRSKIPGAGGSGGTGGTTPGGGGTGGTLPGGGGTGGMPGGGGTGGMPGGGGTGGSMCAGGVKSCGTPADCDPTGNVCIEATCEGGCCGTANVPDNTATTTQTDGDCQEVQCDGAGNTKSVALNTDVPPDSGECHTGVCNAGAPGQDPKDALTACTTGGTVCDGAGNCVECLDSTQCSDPTPFCTPSHTCVTAECNDGEPNGEETDVDCGGPDCAKCGTGMDCLVAGDCTNGVCSGTPLTCQAPTCSDGVKNGDETDIDCGGSCAAAPTNKTCNHGQGCGAPTDCVTNACNGVTCTYKPQATACSAHIECGPAASALCVDGVCCNTSCTGTCEACAIAAGGSADGSCTAIAAGVDPGGECTQQDASTCGTTGECDGNRACAVWAAGTACRAASGACDVADTCPGGGSACPNNFAPANTPCSEGSCNGASYSPDVHCTGNSATCDTATPVDCAATGDVCDPTSGCVECSTAADCAAASCSGSTLTPAETCSTSHTCVAGTPVDCAATGNVCDPTAGCVQCNTAANCAPASCTGSTLTPAETCSTSHVCAAGTAAACPGSLTCASSSACNTACGTADATGDANCVSGFYCDGANGGACQTKLGASATCTRDGECANGTCTGAPTGTCN